MSDKQPLIDRFGQYEFEFMNVVPLTKFKVLKAHPHPDVLDTLEDLLERTVTGEIRAIAYACLLRGGGCSTAWTAGSSTEVMTLDGATGTLQWRMRQALNSNREPVQFDPEDPEDPDGEGDDE